MFVLKIRGEALQCQGSGSCSKSSIAEICRGNRWSCHEISAGCRCLFERVNGNCWRGMLLLLCPRNCNMQCWFNRPYIVPINWLPALRQLVRVAPFTTHSETLRDWPATQGFLAGRRRRKIFGVETKSPSFQMNALHLALSR